ncbi:Hsp20/alpha crystallin family protein [Planococcus shenhongbingii]|uniref:Hsp20/alpha crystallin family protein n=1 Tax=Planococcus shenhongbingii TaxID=3058398 RepID=A0ABT8NET2_9BACL|nr:Hsp20/alpha crystallin family protein [Planococcus sp. N017]MDN7246417.1 Hsp20/alpha crystallin family protein [Planococcus sp. N017]
MSTLFSRKQTDLFPSLFGSGLESDFFNKFFGENTYPQVDIREKKDGYEFMVDLPGFSKEEVEVEYKDGYLEIRGERNQSWESNDEEGRFVRKERSYGAFKRSFYIGEIDEKQIAGSFEKGVLMLDVPKSTEQSRKDKGYRIPIE